MTADQQLSPSHERCPHCHQPSSKKNICECCGEDKGKPVTTESTENEMIPAESRKMRYFKTLGIYLFRFAMVVLITGAIIKYDLWDGEDSALLVGLAIVIFKAGFIFLAARLAQEKQRNAVLWGIIVAVSSIIGTTVLLLIPYADDSYQG